MCRPGFQRDQASGACAALGEALGRECDSATNPCDDAKFSYCKVPDEGTPYCTAQGCTSNEECPGGYGCDTRTSPSFCDRVPEGVGTPCAADAECAGTKASFCDTFITNTCLVNMCVGPEVTCYGGTVCCDYSALGLPLSVCVPTGNLEAGACPLRGLIVED